MRDALMQHTSSFVPGTVRLPSDPEPCRTRSYPMHGRAMSTRACVKSPFTAFTQWVDCLCRPKDRDDTSRGIIELIIEGVIHPWRNVLTRISRRASRRSVVLIPIKSPARRSLDIYLLVHAIFTPRHQAKTSTPSLHVQRQLVCHYLPGFC
jgi:hypothetical protein